MATSPLSRLLIVCGATASGKTELGITLAEELDGEIISADSVSVYRGLDIGSDKPPPTERRDIPHHMIDICDPRHRFSAGDFVKLAMRAITEVRRRQRTPIIVGGTIFYIRALLTGLVEAPPRNRERSTRLDWMWQQDPALLFARLRHVDPATASAIGARDRQRIVRALDFFETTGIALSKRKMECSSAPRFQPFIVVPSWVRNRLYARIDRRVDTMFSGGLLEEISELLDSGIPSDAHAFKAIGYRQGIRCLRGLTSIEEAILDTKKASRDLAKKQLRSLRRGFPDHIRVEQPVHQDDIDELIAAWTRF